MSVPSTPPPLSDSSSVGSPSSFSSSDAPIKPDSDSLENLAFDSPEAFNLLLQTITQNAESVEASSSNSPQDWIQMSSWTTGEPKVELDTDFNFAFPMDLDFEPNMVVDPSALHFNPSVFPQTGLGDTFLSGSGPSMNDLLGPSVFPTYHNASWADTQLGSSTERRLSITSSSSSSGASLSPVLGPQSSIASSASSDNGFSELDPAAELAQRVRQIAGVTLAVPISAQIAAAVGQAKLPIPRLSRVAPAAPALKQVKPASSPVPEASPAATPPASEAGESSSAAHSPEATQPSTSVLGRPKTSHTTIERRYRTNLNARITGLKQSVPALRVLEAKNGNGNNPWNDIVDTRGFVDGVKVARKMSKANILGKATEYIRVLKKREARLKREQDGLKSLVGGLVGGPALLKEWEKEWREKFGGEENDEVEGEDLAAASDDEDDDSDGEDGEEGRARKKAKVAKAPKEKKPSKLAPSPPIPAQLGVVPEKRKRGRPRKTPLPPTTPMPLAPSLPLEHPPVIAAVPTDMFQNPSSVHGGIQQSAPQYLLAAFAFFSVFNSPLASSYTRSHSSGHSPHAHHGTVLTGDGLANFSHPPVLHTSAQYGTHELIQAFHLLVSTLVFFYVVTPWLSNLIGYHGNATIAFQKVKSYITKSYKSTPTPPGSPIVKTHQRGALMDALSPVVRGSGEEATRLRSALGVSTGVSGLLQSVLKAARIDRGLEMNQLEQRAWVRLGELIAFDDTVPLTTRIQTYWCMSWHVSTFATSTVDLTTLALIIRPFSHAKATELWDRAKNKEILRPYEKIVLSNMSVDDAAEWLARWHRWHDTERKDRCAACEKRTPLGVLAAIMIRERLRKHAAAMFVRTVIPSREHVDEYNYDGEEQFYDAEKDWKNDQERKETIEAGRSIGGRTAELATLLERIWDTGFCSHEDVLNSTGSSNDAEEFFDCEDEHDLASSDEAEIRSLLSATIIYRRIFPSSFPSCATAVSVILSPPPSPSRKNFALHTLLKTALASSAFDYDGDRLDDERLGAALEDARDRVGDMLAELERSLRRNARVVASYSH